jgi:hypothetical protein
VAADSASIEPVGTGSTRRAAGCLLLLLLLLPCDVEPHTHAAAATSVAPAAAAARGGSSSIVHSAESTEVARAERERFAPSRRTTRPRASSGERCEARWQRPAGTLRCGRAARAKQGGALQGGAAGWPLGGAVPRNKRHAREAWNRIQQKGHIAVALPPASTWLSHGLTTSLVADHCRRVRGDKTLRVLLPAQHRNISNG